MTKLKEEEISEENVVVEKTKLDKILSEFSGLQEKVKLLESIADKTQLAKYLEKHRDATKRTCRLRGLRNDKGEFKVIISWGRMVTNEVFQNAQGVSVAKQVVNLVNEDGEELVGELLDIGRRYEYITAEKVEKIKDYLDDKDAKWEVWKVKAENGKTYDIDSHFIN